MSAIKQNISEGNMVPNDEGEAAIEELRYCPYKQ